MEVHKRKIYSVKYGSGKIYGEGSLPATLRAIALAKKNDRIDAGKMCHCLL